MHQLTSPISFTSRYAPVRGSRRPNTCLLSQMWDLEQKTYTVTEHLDLGYRPKDKEEGTLPIPDLLVDALRERRKRNPITRLIFPGKHGKPNGHALRIVKRLALRAGVNCGQCMNKKGLSCSQRPVCRNFVLHKMRKTFASTLHHKGLPAQTLQRYLRHSDLDTTLKYIADQLDDQVRETINATFSGSIYLLHERNKGHQDHMPVAFSRASSQLTTYPPVFFGIERR